MKTIRLFTFTLSLIFCLLFATYCDESDDSDDDDDDDNDDNDDDSPAKDDDTSAVDDDVLDDDQAPAGPEDITIFVIYGFPGLMERGLVDLYLQHTGFAQNGDIWTFTDIYNDRRYTLKEGWTAEALIEALTTQDAYVMFIGHSNFGYGATFTDDPWAMELDEITDINDILNFGSEQVAVQYRYFVEHQAYPNFTVKPAQIPEAPLNYLTEVLGLERFANIDGIAPGMTFGPVQGEGLDQFTYHATEAEPFPPLDMLVFKLLGLDLTVDDRMLITEGGSADLPELKYKVLFYKSCYSSLYFLDNLQHGVVFYTTGTPSYLRPTAFIFLRGLIQGSSWDAIKNSMNWLDDIYDYRVFDDSQEQSPQKQGLTPVFDRAMRSMFIERTLAQDIRQSSESLLALLHRPMISLWENGHLHDTGGETLAARWALAELGEEALDALLLEVADAPATYKANLLYSLAEFDNPLAEAAIRDALTDERFVPRASVEAAGMPLRVSDVAYNILVRHSGRTDLFAPLGEVHSLEFRDACRGDLGAR